MVRRHNVFVVLLWLGSFFLCCDSFAPARSVQSLVGLGYPPWTSSSSSSSSSSTALSGIAGLRAWYKSAFPSAVVELVRPRKIGSRDDYSRDYFDHVLIDMNSVLHICLRRNRNNFEKSLLSTLSVLDEQLSVTRPRKSVVLAFDGPPPAAKLMTQKKRRHSVSRLADASQLIKAMLASKQVSTTTDGVFFRWHKSMTWREEKRRSANKSDLNVVTSMLLTPGTVNMNQATAAAVHYIWNHLSSSPQYANVTFTVSSSNAAGEGEVKLLEWLLRPDSPIVEGDSTVLVGGDGDLLLEALAVPPGRCTDLFVFTPGGKERDSCISVWELTRELLKRFPALDSVFDLYNVRIDIVLLLLLNGNDYLPRMGRAGFDELFEAYSAILSQRLANLPAATATAPSSSSSSSSPRPRPTFLFDLKTLDINAKFATDLFSMRLSRPDLNDLNEDIALHAAELATDFTSAPAPSPPDAVAGAAQRASCVPAPTTPTDFPLPPAAGGSSSSCSSGERRPAAAQARALLQYLIIHGLVPRTSELALQPDFLVSVDEPLAGSAANVTFNVSLTVGGAQGTEKVTLHRPGYQNQRRQLVVEKLANDMLTHIFGADYLTLLRSWEEWDERGAPRGDAVPDMVPPADTDEYVRGIRWNMNMYLVGGCLDYSYNYGKRPAPSARALYVHFSALLHSARGASSPSPSPPLVAPLPSPFYPSSAAAALRPLPAPLAGIAVLPPSRRGLVDVLSFPHLRFKELYGPLLGNVRSVGGGGGGGGGVGGGGGRGGTSTTSPTSPTPPTAVDDAYDLCTNSVTGALDYGRFKCLCFEIIDREFYGKHGEHYLDYLARVQAATVSASRVGEILVGDKSWAQFSRRGSEVSQPLSKGGVAASPTLPMAFEPPTLELSKYPDKLPLLERDDSIDVKHARHEPQLWLDSLRYEDVKRELGTEASAGGGGGVPLLQRLDAKRTPKEAFKKDKRAGQREKFAATSTTSSTPASTTKGKNKKPAQSTPL